MTIAKGQTITIEGHRCPYVVRAVFGEDGGAYALELEPTQPPYQLVTLTDVHEERGVIYTLDLEKIAVKAPEKASTCRSCGAPIRWSVSTSGKREYGTPMNADGTSHWGTCPQAAQWRKSTAPEPVAHGEETVAPTPAKPEGQLSLF